MISKNNLFNKNDWTKENVEVDVTITLVTADSQACPQLPEITNKYVAEFI